MFELPEPDGIDGGGQVYFDGGAIRVDTTGGSANPPVVVMDGIVGGAPRR